MKQLRIKIYWGDLLYHCETLALQGRFTVGPDPNSHFIISPLRNLISGPVLSFEKKQDTYLVRIAPNVGGYLKKGSEPTLLRDLTHPELPYDCQLDPFQTACFTFGDFSFYVDWTSPVALLEKSTLITKEYGVFLLVLIPLLYGIYIFTHELPPRLPPVPESPIKINLESDPPKEEPIVLKLPPDTPTQNLETVKVPQANSQPKTSRPVEETKISQLGESLFALESTNAPPKTRPTKVSSGTTIAEAKDGIKTSVSSESIQVDAGLVDFKLSQVPSIVGAPSTQNSAGLSFSLSEFETFIKNHQNKIRACFAKLAPEHNRQYRFKIRININPNGQVTQSRLVEADFLTSALDRCINSNLRLARLPLSTPLEHSVQVDCPVEITMND